MAGFSTYLQTTVLAWLKGAAMPSAPASLYVALFSADPTDAGSTASEVTTTIRTAGRVAATFGAASTAAGASTIATSAVVDFGSAANAADVSHFAIFDAANGGNMLGSDALAAPYAIGKGMSVTFPAAALKIAVG